LKATLKEEIIAEEIPAEEIIAELKIANLTNQLRGFRTLCMQYGAKNAGS